MPNINSGGAPKSIRYDDDDDEVFHLLAEARQQYERYLQVLNSTTTFALLETPAVPPSPDLPLSLTIRPNG